MHGLLAVDCDLWQFLSYDMYILLLGQIYPIVNIRQKTTKLKMSM